MDGVRFDSLARSLTTAGSRRAALAVVLSGSLGLLGVAHSDTIKAKKSKKKKPCPPCKKRKQGKCKGTKPNGTLCAGGACQSGACVAAPAPPGPPPPVPGCTNGSIDSGGQVCVNGTFQDCTSYTQCGTITGAGARACYAGRCRGGELCNNSAECFKPMLCLDPVEAEGQPDLCQVDFECNANFGATGPAVFACAAADPVCVVGDCTRQCIPGGNCPGARTCQGGVCLPPVPA